MSTKTRVKNLKLDLACGQNPAEGFTGVDIWEGAEVQHDLTEFPWPWPDRSVAEVHCSHFVEHLPLEVIYGGKLTDGLCAFMNELGRVLKKGGEATIRHPHNRSDRAFQDPTHRRFIPSATWYYFNAEWRKLNALDHYPISCDFEILAMYADGLNDDLVNRNEQAQIWSGERYWNSYADLVVVLKKR